MFHAKLSFPPAEPCSSAGMWVVQGLGKTPLTPPLQECAGISELDPELSGLHLTDIMDRLPPQCLMPVMMWVGFDILLPICPSCFLYAVSYTYCCGTNVFLFTQTETASAEAQKLLGEMATCTCGSNNTWKFLSHYLNKSSLAEKLKQTRRTGLLQKRKKKSSLKEGKVWLQ